MSKSDLAQEAAPHLRELLVNSGRGSKELLNDIAQEYEIEPYVVHAWLLGEFGSLEALDDWAATRREELQRAPELERRRIERLKQELKTEWQEIKQEFAKLMNEMRKCR